MGKTSFRVHHYLVLVLIGSVVAALYKPATASIYEISGGPVSLRCTVSKSIPQLGRGTGSGINVVDDRLEIVNIRAIDVLAFIFGVREQEIVHVGMPLSYPIDAVLEGVRDQSVQLEVLRSIVPAALGITVEMGSTTILGYVLSAQRDSAEGTPAAISDAEVSGNCAVFNGELRATRASGAQIAAALNASGKTPVVWSGEDKQTYTLTMNARGEQGPVIEQICNACRLTAEQKKVVVRTIQVAKRP